uniref:Uncharacterized protein n=1 Tax=mine drainage metagenome TaxID=410659 RepID=E6PXT1_9ZZZZ
MFSGGLGTQTICLYRDINHTLNIFIGNLMSPKPANDTQITSDSRAGADPRIV